MLRLHLMAEDGESTVTKTDSPSLNPSFKYDGLWDYGYRKLTLHLFISLSVSLWLSLFPQSENVAH